MTPRLPASVIIVGRGRLGTALASALERAGVTVVHISHTARPAQKQFSVLGTIVVLAVPDDAILSVSEHVAGWKMPVGTCIVHCSGSRTLRELQACVDVGCRTAALHPFQTIPVNAPLTIFNGVPWGVECVDDDLAWCHAFVDALLGVFVRLPVNNPRAKSCYHAAAVASSNFIQACIALAANACEAAGVNASALLPVISHAAVTNAMNAVANNQPIPFTGPAVRGDISTIKRHLASLGETEGSAYRHFTKALITMASSAGDTSDGAAESVEETLRG